ncbi:hypothetical protein [Bradyrhizobium sp. HKCCYLS20291]|uniref:hypothetical protein n=1 Tax=Bradyrhizobium sp. HKCCYLS20291 TaxID=3420766 RepID=UPI003EB85F02
MNWFMRKRLRAVFGDFLSKEALDTIAQGNAPMPPLERSMVCHVLLQVRDDTAEDVSQNVSDVSELLVREGAMIENILSSLVSAAFPLQASRLDAIEAALGRLGPNVRAVYQAGEYPRGMFGSSSRFAYGTVVPHMSMAMERLLRLEFGRAERLER